MSNQPKLHTALKLTRYAVGAAAFGAAAVGALTIGALAVGALLVRRGRIDQLSIGRLTVDELTVSHLILHNAPASRSPVERENELPPVRVDHPSPSELEELHDPQDPHDLHGSPEYPVAAIGPPLATPVRHTRPDSLSEPAYVPTSSPILAAILKVHPPIRKRVR